MYVHCCHCTWCQRESGTAFALNAMIESDRLTLLNPTESPTLQKVQCPSRSGDGQTFYRCPECLIALWSTYDGGPDSGLLKFVRVGSLDRSECITPNIHIYTSTKLPWVVLNDKSVPVREEYYDWKEFWPAESMERMKVLKAKAKVERELSKEFGKL